MDKTDHWLDVDGQPVAYILNGWAWVLSPNLMTYRFGTEEDFKKKLEKQRHGSSQSISSEPTS